jgi:uncharacterized protein (TIGR02597 family)
MRNKITNFLTAIALAAGILSASAASATVATVPAGMITLQLVHGATNYLSLPLTTTATYTSTVNAVSTSTISVSDAPAPFTSSLAVDGAPYFVKFLSGNEAGRVVLIIDNTSSALSLDIADHATGAPVALDTAGFNVQPGDAFEIFRGDTLASIFGAGTAQSPLLLTGGTSAITSDTVSLFTSVNSPAMSYFYSTVDKCWELLGTNTDANSTVIYPYSAFAVNRQLTHPDTTLVVSGRVTPVAAQTKLVSHGTILTSTHFATDVKLSQLHFGSNWATGSSIISADTLSVYNTTTRNFDTYYQKPDSTWRKFPDAVTDQSNVAIAAGTVTAIAKRSTVTGGATFLHSTLPYSLN